MTSGLQRFMLKLDGSSEYGVHVRIETGDLAFLRHVFRSKKSKINCKDIFFEQPVLSHHLI